MAVNQEQVDKLAKILKDLDPAEWQAVKQAVDKKVLEPNKERPKIVLNTRAASIVTSEGLIVTILKDGEITCAWDGKPLIQDEDPRVWIPVKELKKCINHIIALNDLDFRQKIEELNKVVNDYRQSVGKDVAVNKVRFIDKNSRKAFVHGLLIGRKG